MEFAYTLGGGAPVVKKFIVDSAAAVLAGVPVISNMETADADGIIVVGATAAAGILGVTLDGGTTTAAQVGSTDNAAYASVVINPDAVIRARLNGGATEDTALTVITTSTASTDGLKPCNCTDEFLVWGYSGLNAGYVRRATAAATVVIAMPFNCSVGDEFLETSTVPAEATQWPVITTNATQVNAAGAVDADIDNFTVVENILRDKNGDGRNKSYTFMVPACHAFGQVGTLAT
jgi:hypothetical protein